MINFICCKECEERYPGCQDHCEKYKETKKLRDEQTQKLKSYRQKYMIPLTRKRVITK